MSALAVRAHPETLDEAFDTLQLARRLPENRAAHSEAAEPMPMVGAHAEYRAEDYFFRRTQSRELRETPWGPRLAPMRSWSELASIGLTTAAIGAAVIAGTVALI